jgi:hypothetical protein
VDTTNSSLLQRQPVAHQGVGSRSMSPVTHGAAQVVEARERPPLSQGPRGTPFSPMWARAALRAWRKGGERLSRRLTIHLLQRAGAAQVGRVRNQS